MPTYQQLTQAHPSKNIELSRDRIAMYAGGAAVKARARRFLPQRHREPGGAYAARLSHMTYEPHLGSITDHFASMLFKSKPVAVPTRDGGELHGFESKYYAALKSDANRGGVDMDAIMKSAFIDAATTGLAWILVHDPVDTSDYLEPPKNKLDWEHRGLANFWVQKLDYESVVDWQCDSFGNLIMAVVHSIDTPRFSAISVRDRVVETWRVYSHADVETFQVEYDVKSPPKPNDEIGSISQRAHPFGQVPLLCMQFGPSTHLAARLETSQLAHTHALNAESHALANAAYCQPLFQVADPDSFRGAIQYGVGLIIGQNDKASWLEPTGTAFDALNRAKLNHRDAIYKIASAMALGQDTSAASVGRSADSKAIDHEASRIALRAFADPVKELMQRLYALLSDVRGESVTWRIDGLDDLDVVAYLQALKLLRDGLDGPTHSPQARAALESRAVEALIPDATPEQKNVWRLETLQAILTEPSEQDRELALHAKLHALAAGNDGDHADDDQAA